MGRVDTTTGNNRGSAPVRQSMRTEDDGAIGAYQDGTFVEVRTRVCGLPRERPDFLRRNLNHGMAARDPRYLSR
jgi:hypothetical protein